EMEAEYVKSVKKSILDYVLLDPAEQRRLGLHMPEQALLHKNEAVLIHILLQIPDMDDVTVAFDPTFAIVTGTLHSVVEDMVTSVQGLERVEHQLFYEEDWMKGRHINAVGLDEERVEGAKAMLAKVVEANSAGPL
ncbi:predicted protein, partial [Nematostella vectensis]